MVFAKKIPCHAKEAVLVVTHYDAGNLSGWLFHPHLASPLNIKSFPQMAMLLDALLDQQLISLLLWKDGNQLLRGIKQFFGLVPLKDIVVLLTERLVAFCKCL